MLKRSWSRDRKSDISLRIQSLSYLSFGLAICLVHRYSALWPVLVRNSSFLTLPFKVMPNIDFSNATLITAKSQHNTLVRLFSTLLLNTCEAFNHTSVLWQFIVQSFNIFSFRSSEMMTTSSAKLRLFFVNLYAFIILL